MSKEIYIKNYSCNLLWLGNGSEEGQEYICQKIYSLTTPVTKWAQANRIEDGAEINLWYDSELHTEQAIKNTKEILSSISIKENCHNIKLRDIRDIKIVKDNNFLFSKDVPLYFRIDSLKLIILGHELIAQNKDGAIFADLEVCDLRKDSDGNVTGERFSKNELFATEYLKLLEKSGVLINKSEYGLENQFIQMVNDQSAVKALRDIINLTLLRAENIFKMSADDQEALTPKMHMIPYNVLLKEYHTLYRLNKSISKDCIKVRADIVGEGTDKEWVKYDSKKHGYNPFGLHKSKNSHSVSYFDQFHTLTDEEMLKLNEECDPWYRDKKDVIREIYTRNGNSHTEKPISLTNKNFECKLWDWNEEVISDTEYYIEKKENDQIDHYSVYSYSEEKESDQNSEILFLGNSVECG